MDPQEALARFYAAREEARAATKTAEWLGETAHTTELCLQEAVDAASDLFEWLSKGGFAPNWKEVKGDGQGV